MSMLRYVRMVLWGFFGIRQRAGADDELTRMKPVVLIGVGIVMAGLLGLLVFSLANLAVHTLGH